MPGRPITSQQVQLYMDHRDHLGQAGAAAKAGISERSGRRLDCRGGALPVRLDRGWRTRADPLGAVWDSVVVPLLRREGGRLLGTTVLGHLQELHPGEFGDGLLRTVQRRVSLWKLKYGPAPDLIGASDFRVGRIGDSSWHEIKSAEMKENGSAESLAVAKSTGHVFYFLNFGVHGFADGVGDVEDDGV